MFNQLPQFTKPARQTVAPPLQATAELAFPVSEISDAAPESASSDDASLITVTAEQIDLSAFEPESIAQNLAEVETPTRGDVEPPEQREPSSVTSQDATCDREFTDNQTPQMSLAAGHDQLLGTSETSALVGTW